MLLLQHATDLAVSGSSSELQSAVPDKGKELRPSEFLALLEGDAYSGCTASDVHLKRPACTTLPSLARCVVAGELVYR